jgi:hypothetical protein
MKVYVYDWDYGNIEEARNRAAWGCRKNPDFLPDMTDRFKHHHEFVDFINGKMRVDASFEDAQPQTIGQRTQSVLQLIIAALYTVF